ncbi:hypothetical protein IWW34DRAFT_752342 [Fusarium oxysporum f. sp. albedinis]|nr:hypothetical protein IWW34DRAFT_752342 [Fusarium oxysporum f. sp. albedinis]
MGQRKPLWTIELLVNLLSSLEVVGDLEMNRSITSDYPSWLLSRHTTFFRQANHMRHHEAIPLLNISDDDTIPLSIFSDVANLRFSYSAFF